MIVIGGIGIVKKQKINEVSNINNEFYQKLANGQNVSILIVGDSIGNGAGATDNEHKWTNLLKKSLETNYHTNVTLNNISMGGNSSYAGYVRTMVLDDEIDYDLIIICYGQNDETNNFELYYEAIIRAVKGKYPEAVIYAILESSQRDYTEKMQKIMHLAEYYGIPIVDTIAPFQMEYDSKVIDGIHPNNRGQEIYSKEILKVIEQCISERCIYNLDNSDVVNANVLKFDNFKWYDVSDFTREENIFILKTKVKGHILGIDYSFMPGNNKCKILIDNKLPV